jgi:hypothetical protein
MSSTALSHLPTASQAPLFFRLDTRSQRLVALTDVMQTPLHWLDEPRSAWPAQLPDALRQPIEQRLASGKGASWCCALTPSSGTFPLPRAGRLLAHLPADPVPGERRQPVPATAAPEPDGQPAAV